MNEVYLQTFKVSQAFILADVSQIYFSQECILHKKSFFWEFFWEYDFTYAATFDTFIRRF